MPLLWSYYSFEEWLGLMYHTLQLQNSNYCIPLYRSVSARIPLSFLIWIHFSHGGAKFTANSDSVLLKIYDFVQYTYHTSKSANFHVTPFCGPISALVNGFGLNPVSKMNSGCNFFCTWRLQSQRLADIQRLMLKRWSFTGIILHLRLAWDVRVRGGNRNKFYLSHWLRLVLD